MRGFLIREEDHERFAPAGFLVVSSEIAPENWLAGRLNAYDPVSRELSILATRLIRDFPDQLKYYSIKEFTYNGIRQGNRNLLLTRDPSVDGLKTGYTDAAGYCLIATAKRDYPGGARRLVSVVLGTASREARANESQKLLNWGHSAFDVVKLFDANQQLKDMSGLVDDVVMRIADIQLTFPAILVALLISGIAQISFCSTFATRLRCSSTAPLDTPVVPPVYCSTAMSSGLTAGRCSVPAVPRAIASL